MSNEIVLARHCNLCGTEVGIGSMETYDKAYAGWIEMSFTYPNDEDSEPMTFCCPRCALAFLMGITD